MAFPTNTVSTHTTKGDREDLADIIYNISPMDTPFLSMASTSRAKAVFHEWQTDSLAAAASNAQIEGDEVTAESRNPTTRVGNYLQISRKAVSVTATARAIDQAGRADEYAYQLTKQGHELKRDMEYALVREQGSSAGGETMARQLGGLEAWLTTNKGTQGSSDATTAGFSSGTVTAPTDATTVGALTKTALDGQIQNCWTEGGDPSIIMCGPFNRTQISTFSGISTLQTDASPKNQVTLMGAIDLYKSNFGTHKVVPNRFQRDRTVFLLDFDYLGIAKLRDMQEEKLAKTSDSDRSFVVTEYTLVVKNEAASGKVTDCTTS